MCDHQQSLWIESDNGQVSDSSVNSGNKKCVRRYSRAFRVILEVSVLHAEQCAAMSWKVVKRLANHSHVNCSLDVIGQSDWLTFLPSRV